MASKQRVVIAKCNTSMGWEVKKNLLEWKNKKKKRRWEKERERGYKRVVTFDICIHIYIYRNEVRFFSIVFYSFEKKGCLVLTRTWRWCLWWVASNVAPRKFEVTKFDCIVIVVRVINACYNLTWCEIFGFFFLFIFFSSLSKPCVDPKYCFSYTIDSTVLYVP